MASRTDLELANLGVVICRDLRERRHALQISDWRSNAWRKNDARPIPWRATRHITIVAGARRHCEGEVEQPEAAEGFLGKKAFGKAGYGL